MRLVGKFTVLALALMLVASSMVNVLPVSASGAQPLDFIGDDGGGSSYPVNAEQTVYDYPPENALYSLTFISKVTLTSSSTLVQRSGTTYRTQIVVSRNTYSTTSGIGNRKHILTYTGFVPDWTQITNRSVVAKY